MDVRAGSPAARAGLADGDEIIAIIDAQGLRHNLTGLEAIESRDQIRSYEMWNDTRAANATTWSIIDGHRLEFELHDGRRLTVFPQEGRSALSLPPGFFILLIQSLIIVLIAAGILAFAPHSLPVALLVTSGIAISVNMLIFMALTACELAMPPAVQSLTFNLGSVGITVFSLSLLALLWYFPMPIARFPFGKLVVIFGLFVLSAQYFQYFAFPPHPYQTPLLLTQLGGVILSVVSWRRTRGKPLERASVMWFILSIVGVCVLVVLAFNIPVFFGLQPIFGANTALFAITFVYVGVALGTLRYRLFDIHRIWWRTITWAVGGLVVLLVDVILVAQFDFEQATALPLALVLAGWGYFPVRQIVFEYFVTSRRVRVEDYLPELIKMFSGVKQPDEFDGRLIAFLRHVFQAEEIGPIRHEVSDRATVSDNGLALEVPDLSGTRTVQIIGKAKGRQLFSTDDVSTAQTIVRLVRYLADLSRRELEDITDDRRRIVRDLHDDVGGRLLSLVYSAPDDRSARAARGALAALKDSLIVIEDTETIDVEMAWANIRAEATERLSVMGIALEVAEDFQSSRVLSAREYLNFKRIFQEIASNMIKYAQPTVAHVAISVALDGQFVLRASNRIAALQETVSSTHRGHSSITTRAAEIGGTVSFENRWDDEGGIYEITVTLPFAE
jgi:signal transduction histidine kinase